LSRFRLQAMITSFHFLRDSSRETIENGSRLPDRKTGGDKGDVLLVYLHLSRLEQIFA
jgi:hypothetical protein